MLTNQGRQKFFHEGFMYTFDRQSADGTKLFWRCAEKGNACRARLHTLVIDDSVFHTMHEHSHGCDASSTEITVIKSIMREYATSTVETPAQIFNRVTTCASIASLGQLPSKDAARKMIQRRRRAGGHAITQPLTLCDLDIPESYTVYESAPGHLERFLLHDTGTSDANRVLMFGRESHADWTHHVKRLYVDGTFSLAPPLFAQVFVVMAEREDFVHAIAYFLLPNKLRATYTVAFSLLRQVWPTLIPEAINMDFEQAVIDSARASYPDAEICGCLFHLTRNMRNRLVAERLSLRYRTEATFALWCRMIVGVAFVPIPDITTAIDTLARNIPHELIPIIDWMEDNYVGRLNTDGTRRPARFPPTTWSVYERSRHGNARTNNYAEAAHRRLQAEFAVDHPSIWKFIDGLRRTQKGRDAMFERYVHGERPTIKRRKYVQADERIRRLVDSYSERNILEYLRGIASNFLME
jgi:hypothetical protein